jgi:hypothetical protein
MPAAPETESSESSVLASVYSVTVEPSFSLCLGACVYVGQCCRYFLCVRVCVCVDSSICVHVCADTTHRQLQANSEKFPTVANAQHLANAHAHTHTHTHAHTQPYAELSEYERSIEERVNAIVAAFDINNDGVISYEEFLMPFPDAETQHTLMYRSQRTPPPASAQTQPQSIKASQPSARTTATTITTVSRMNLSQLELHEVSKLFSLLCFACVSLCAFTCVCASGV